MFSGQLTFCVPRCGSSDPGCQGCLNHWQRRKNTSTTHSTLPRSMEGPVPSSLLRSSKTIHISCQMMVLVVVVSCWIPNSDLGSCVCVCESVCVCALRETLTCPYVSHIGWHLAQEHWSAEKVSEGLRNGQILRGRRRREAFQTGGTSPFFPLILLFFLGSLAKQAHVSPTARTDSSSQNFPKKKSTCEQHTQLKTHVSSYSAAMQRNSRGVGGGWVPIGFRSRAPPRGPVLKDG